MKVHELTNSKAIVRSFKVICIIFSEIDKSTYFIAAYQSDQDVKDALLLGEHIITAFKSDHRDVVEVYSKHHYASYYHRSFYPKSLQSVHKQNGITLRQLDYKEPQKVNDQCNGESTVARNMIRFFVYEKMIFLLLKISTKPL